MYVMTETQMLLASSTDDWRMFEHAARQRFIETADSITAPIIKRKMGRGDDARAEWLNEASAVLAMEDEAAAKASERKHLFPNMITLTLPPENAPVDVDVTSIVAFYPDWVKAELGVTVLLKGGHSLFVAECMNDIRAGKKGLG